MDCNSKSAGSTPVTVSSTVPVSPSTMTLVLLAHFVRDCQSAFAYCSEVKSIVTEWQCFVRYGKILDIRRYKGGPGKIYSLQKVNEMISSYSDAPAAYSLDIGLTSEVDTIIVEVNDGYSLGSYELDPLLYAKLLSARWAELTGTEDECAFDLR